MENQGQSKASFPGHGWIHKLYRLSLRRKLAVMSIFLLLPFTVITAFLLFTLNRYCTSYDTIVQNITKANEYNVAFKEEIDSVTYQMVARSLTKTGVEMSLGMVNPDTTITQAEQTFDGLRSTTNSEEAQGRIKSIIKLMITLRKRVNDIDTSISAGGHYEENMTRLDTDIRIITELIQERISEFIYFESESMETIRSQMEAQRQALMRWMVVVECLLLIGTIYLAVMISRSITRPIEALCRVIGEVGQGNFEVRARAYKEDETSEIAILSRSFNSMIEQIGELVQNIRQEQSNSRNLELKLLQAQINPHFLYNTLDNIVWLAEDQRTDEIEEIVTSLSQFFRTTLSGGKDYIKIKEEISHIEAYLKIQQFRYRDILRYRIEIPEELYEYRIIKMALQPIVENALYHGIKNKRTQGLIRIYTTQTVDSIEIIVEDDGIGMNPDELQYLQRIMSGREKAQEDNTGFGMANVAERMRLNYGQAYGLSCDSTYGVGTRVMLRIPKQMEN